MTEEIETISFLIESRTEIKTVGPVGQEQVYEWPPASDDIGTDNALLSEVEGLARSVGAAVERSTKSSSRTDETPHYGGFPFILVAVETLSFTWPYVVGGAVTAAGIASFLNNALGAIEKWESLRGGRSVRVSYKGRTATIEAGDDAKAVLEKLDRLVRDA